MLALIVILVSGNIFIPSYEAQHLDKQLLKIKGKHLKYSDSPHVKDFLLSVKNNDGYICMGTSESTPLRDGNYYEFLDQDTSYETRFSILGGAGWTCGLHMPMLLQHKNEVRSLKLIYFINPVYWRSELNGFDKGYWNRYLNYSYYKEVLKHDEDALLHNISLEYSQELNTGQKFLSWMEYHIRKLRKPFFQDLRYYLFQGDYKSDLAFLAEEKTGFNAFEYFGTIDTTYLDTNWNISHEFKGRTWLNPMIDNDYRTKELRSFIHLCNLLEVEVTYVLGPINERYIKKYHPPYLEGYQNTLGMLASVLRSEDVDWIDLTYLGSVPGSFIDNQHHSSYGAYFIYQDIKKHLNEKEDL